MMAICSIVCCSSSAVGQVSGKGGKGKEKGGMGNVKLCLAGKVQMKAVQLAS